MKLIVILFICLSCIYCNIKLYRTTEQVDAEMTNLVTKYKELITEHSISDFYKNKNIHDQGKSLSDFSKYALLKFYDIKKPLKSSSKLDNALVKKRIYLLFGEHPRELISVEYGLNYIKSLIENTNNNKNKNSILDNYDIRVVINANPLGRQKVEKGEYCRRANLNNVDINRNWDYMWNKDITIPSEEFPGQKPFSEVETMFIKDTMEDFKPNIFLTVHSGFYGLFIPYAYDSKECKTNNSLMKNLLNNIKQKYCSICDVGSPSMLIGYKSSGTSLDYAFKILKVPVTYAWEIYSNEKVLPEMSGIQNQNVKNLSMLNFIQKKSIVKLKYDKSLIKDLLYNSSKTKFTDFENQVCFALFNPLDKQSYDYIIKNWSNALNELFEYYRNQNFNFITDSNKQLRK